MVLHWSNINPYRNWSIRDLVWTKLKYTRYGVYEIEVYEIWVYEIGFTVIGRYTELKVYEMSRHRDSLNILSWRQQKLLAFHFFTQGHSHLPCWWFHGNVSFFSRLVYIRMQVVKHANLTGIFLCTGPLGFFIWRRPHQSKIQWPLTTSMASVLLHFGARFQIHQKKKCALFQFLART